MSTAGVTTPLETCEAEAVMPAPIGIIALAAATVIYQSSLNQALVADPPIEVRVIVRLVYSPPSHARFGQRPRTMIGESWPPVVRALEPVRLVHSFVWGRR